MPTIEQIVEKQESKKVSLFDDPYMDLWVLLDQTRDVVARARELELNHFKLTRAQASVLFILMRENRGLTIAEISNWNAREQNSVLTLVNRMAKSGLVEKSRDRDKNKMSVVITEKGRSLYADVTRLSVEMIFSILSDEEKQQFKSILKKIRVKSRELLGIDFRPAFLP